MRFREPFCLYKRDISKNRSVWYYKTYDEEGKRTCGTSTGLTSKTKARLYCMELYRKDKLIPRKKSKLDERSFHEYSQNWWEYDTCSYIRAKLARGNSFSRGHAKIQRMNLDTHIEPVFGKFKLKEITPAMIEDWLLNFSKGKKNLSNTTANHNLQTLRIMLSEAKRLGIISTNPAEGIKPLHQKSKEKGILTQKEVKKLFNLERAEENWLSPISRMMNQLAACTAMRLGEVVALQCEDVKDDHILVHRSYDRTYGLKDTKTHDYRTLPIPKSLMVELKILKEENKTGFLFSLTQGEKPFFYRRVTEDLYKALDKIEIKDRKIRNITFHSWRHYFNSLMRAHNISDSKVQKITGHQSDGMTEHYTHYQPEDFKEVKDLQENVFNFNETA